MPIHVTCSDCRFAFLVDDEFAGRLGRCPQCETVLQVPGVSAEPPAPVPEPNLDPYHSHQSAKAFDEFPSRRQRPEDYREPQPKLRKKAVGPPILTFDKEARAARWHAVSNGLRNLMVSVILVAVSQGVWLAFLFADGVHPGQVKQFGAREKALNIGDLVFLGLGLLLWGMGRIACGRVPFVPARRVARPAAIIAGLTTASGIIGLCGLVFGVIMLQQNLGVGGLLILTGFCSLFPSMCGFIVAEVMGLVSQMRIASGLHDAAFARASRVQFILALLLSAMCLAGTCAFSMFVAMETNKKQQEEMQKQREKNKAAALANKKDAPGKDKPKQVAPPAPVGKQFGNGMGQRNGRGAQQPQPQPQPRPEIDLGDYPEVMYAVMTGWLLVVLTYTLASIFCFQLGRSAIRREIANLVGDPHDHAHGPNQHYLT